MEKKQFLNGNKPALIIFLISAVLSFVLIIVGVVVHIVENTPEQQQQQAQLSGEVIRTGEYNYLDNGYNEFVFKETYTNGYGIISVSGYTNLTRIVVVDALGNQLLYTTAKQSSYTFTTRNSSDIQIKITVITDTVSFRLSYS